jgi:predicted DCC family thiol-disulfide oxidoreductase YuxK
MAAESPRTAARWCTDPVYRLFVRHRYRIFGKRSECLVPSSAERSRFLD